MKRCIAFLGGLILAALSVAANAADPLYLARPFDEITLDENNGGAKLKVQPLNLPGRKVPDATSRKEDVEIELVDRPGERFRVGWNNIAGIKFFEELVLAEAQERVKEERFDEAYPYFQFLETKYSQTPGLKDAAENFLWVQIGSEYKAGRNDAALALLVELHQRSPKRQGLSAAFERVTVKLVEEQMAAENFRAARGLLQNLTQRFPELQATTVATHETQMRDKSATRLIAAREALFAGKFRDACQATRQALDIWPKVEGGRELAQEIHQKYPVVSVGVTSPSARSPLTARDDWANRRTRRLMAPTLFEQGSAQANENPYRSALGQVVSLKDPRQFVFHVRSDARWPGSSRPVTAHDVARSLLAAADAQEPALDAAWANLLESVDVRGQDEVLIELKRPPLRLEAWLQMPLPAVGPYRIDNRSARQVIFVRQSGATADGPAPPSEIVERVFSDFTAALRALRRGEISVIDRVSPWELKRLAGSKEIAVGRYALPSVHVLAPNSRRPLAASRTLKRAILYAIDRESILRRSLLDGQTIAGCDLLSGPFPRGQTKDDLHGYAYDASVEVKPYDPGLAMALSRLAAAELQVEQAQPAAASATTLPPLVLAYPAEPVPRVACQSVARQLELAGFKIGLRELVAGEAVGNDVDLVYTELAMQEPVVDVWHLFGPQGIAGNPSPAMLAALRNLEAAADWQQATDRLHAIHRLAAAELPVIPLWQLAEHFAYHTSVKGIGQRPVTLYQDVDQWQVELRLPGE